MKTTLLAPRSPPLGERGISLVELLIGIAVGLFVVAAAAFMLSANLSDSRRLLLETMIQQDLRATADLIARDLRRAGYWNAAESGVWYRGSPGVASNPYGVLSPTSDGNSQSVVTFNYAKDDDNVVGSNEQFGFRLRNAVVEMQLGNGNWQAMTDSNTLSVTAFAVTLHKQVIVLADFCSKACPSGSTTCPPTQEVREFAIEMTGRAVSDPSVQRSLRSRVRLRNDARLGACPA